MKVKLCDWCHEKITGDYWNVSRIMKMSRSLGVHAFNGLDFCSLQCFHDWIGEKISVTK